jgi:hypothetical protein
MIMISLKSTLVDLGRRFVVEIFRIGASEDGQLCEVEDSLTKDPETEKAYYLSTP